MTLEQRTHSGTATRRTSARLRRKQLAGLLFVAPALCLVLLFFVIPLGMAFWMSLHNWPLLGRPRFIWFGNYVRLAQDAQFWTSMRFTVYYTLIVTVAIFAVAFPLALFVEKSRPLIKFYRTAFFLPVVVGFGSASLLWAWLLECRLRTVLPGRLPAGADRQAGQSARRFRHDLLVDRHHGRVEDGGLQHDHPADRPAGHFDRGPGSRAHGRRFRLAALPTHHAAAHAPHDRAGAHPVGRRLDAGLRPVLHHRRRRPAEQHGHCGLLDIQPVLRVLPPRLRRGAVDGAPGHPGR